MEQNEITQTEVIYALQKYNIEFGFPNNSKNGELITVWSDLYHYTRGKTQELIEAIDNDPNCPFFTFPDIMLATFKLKRREYI